ncbi:MAG: beta-propeller domain-containing protein [Hyphomonadaceae bacterium]
MKRLLAGLALVALIGSASAQDKGQTRAAITEPPVWDQLERFADERDFLAYVRDVRSLRQIQRDDEYSPSNGVVPPPMAPPPPPPPPPPSPSPSAADSVVVTAQARSEAPATMPDGSSITNVQTQGVDEGGIVKRVGRFLVILQDGRLFVTDTRPGGQPGLALASRTNVYRYTGQHVWYDEMLTSGNRILVTGYSYSQAASEVTIFNLSDDGQLTREAVYYISSNDYYDSDNYATRLVNGNLVIYTPLDLTMVDPDAPVRWPLVRRWLRDNERDAVLTAGRPLFDAHDIYKPVQSTREPMVHSVSVCPLGGPQAGDELECRTTGFVGANQREFFVSTQDIYLWVSPGWSEDPADCDGGLRATLYQVPLNGESPRAIHARGVPNDQFGLDATPTEFRALVNLNTRCGAYNAPAELRYLRIPFTELSTRPHAAANRAYARVPNPGTPNYETRFTETHLVYSARPNWSSYPEGRNNETQTARVFVVPTERPQAAREIEAPHGVIRVERAGAGIIMTGYRNEAGLSLSALELGARPHITSTEVLMGRYEAENRSHAFNALVGREGEGLMGLPTVQRAKEGGRWYWRSDSSDISYLSINSAGVLNEAGTLSTNTDARHPSYQCEVSCVDWYGNTRALFFDGRVFGLSGTELIEGDYANGHVGELRRLNLSAPPPRR